jgi:hypothetical protein
MSSVSPTGVTAKSPKEACPPWRRMSFSIMRGPEATMVRVPPRMAANPTGMSSRDSGSPVRLAMRSSAGRKSAAAPMFCMKAEMAPTAAETRLTRRRSLEPATRRMGRVTFAIMPERSTPRPRIMTPMMETTALLDSPASASRGSTKPSHGSASMTQSATTSTRSHSLTKRKMVMPRTAKVRMISVLMCQPSLLRPKASSMISCNR